MTIARTSTNQINIVLSSGIDSFGLQRLLDYAKYLEATANIKAKQSDADNLADELNEGWWQKNKHCILSIF